MKPNVLIINVASTSRLFHAMEDDMDIDAGVVLDGRDLVHVTDAIWDLALRVMNGGPSQR